MVSREKASLSSEEAMKDRPHIINPWGEEIWLDFRKNMDLVKLLPHCSSRLHRHNLTKHFAPLVGNPTLVVDGKKITLCLSIIPKVDPKVPYQIFNYTDKAVVYVVTTS